MENATKALIIAGSVLISILVMSLGAYLYSIFGTYSSNTAMLLEEKNLNEFNTKFTKYLSYIDDNGELQNKCRIQDIISVTNLVKENNERYQLTKADIGKNTYYIQVDVIFNNPRKLVRNYEDKSFEEYKEDLKKISGRYNNSTKSYEIIEFKCTNVEFNKTTNRVSKISFEQIN